MVLGVIISNLLLELRLAMFLGHLGFQQQNFEPAIARINASSLLLSVLVLLTPTAIHLISDGLPKAAIQKFSYIAAILLLIFYGLNLIFSINSQRDAEILSVLEAEGDQHQLVSDRHPSKLEKPIIILLICTVTLVVISEILVASLEETVKVLGWTKIFTVIIVLPVLGRVVEYITCVTTDLKNKMDLTVAVSIGSTLQVVLFVAPILVIVSSFFPTRLSLEFNVFGMFAATAAVLITSSISSDGQSNWLEGFLLLILYAVLGTAFYLYP